MSEIAKAFEQLQQPASRNPLFNLQIPQVVFNSYGHNYTASELTSVVAFGSQPLIMLIMPPVVAKSFALSLLETVQKYEESTGTKVETIEELGKRIAAYTEAQEK